MKKYRLLIFINKIKYSGASKIAVWLANQFARENFDVTFVTYSEADTRGMFDENVRYICLDCSGKNRIKRYGMVVKGLRSLLKKTDIDLALGFLPVECMQLIMASAGLKIRTIVAERSDPYLEKSLMADLGRFSFRFANGAVFQTEGAKNYFGRRISEKSTVIPNPAFVVETEFIPYNDRPEKISHSARLYIRQKRQDILLKAFSIVARKNDDVILHIYGDGPDEYILKTQAEELGIKNRVVFEGKVSDVEDRIKDSRVFVLSSDYEGIPNALIEALAAGVPGVSTDCSPGGARVLIKDGVNGFVTERGAADALADKILYILSAPDKGAEMAKKAREIVDEFAPEKIYGLWKEYLVSVIERAGKK